MVDLLFFWLLFPTPQPLAKIVSAAFNTMPSIIGKSESDACCFCSLRRTSASHDALEDSRFASVMNTHVPKRSPG